MMKKLHNPFKYHSGTSIIINDGITQIMVDGRDIDPKSEEGKKIVDSTNKRVAKSMKKMDKAFVEMDKAFDKMNDIFDDMFD